MLVTINTDASFHRQFKYGAYAFWAVSNDFKITKSGVFRTKCISSDDAEARCIINALQVVLLAHKGITKVIINTDSLNAIALITNDKEHIERYIRYNKKMCKYIRQAYEEVIQKTTNNFILEFRHVKAHSGISDKRSYVNEWCDTEAKRAMYKHTKINKNK